MPLSICHRHANKFYYVTSFYLIIHKMKAATVVKTIQNGDYLYHESSLDLETSRRSWKKMGLSFGSILTFS